MMFKREVCVGMFRLPSLGRYEPFFTQQVERVPFASKEYVNFLGKLFENPTMGIPSDYSHNAGKWNSEKHTE
jgi:hypothetical protein